MSLNWDITDVRDCNNVCFDRLKEERLQPGQTFEKLLNRKSSRPTTEKDREEHQLRCKEWAQSDLRYSPPALGDTITTHDVSPCPWEYSKDEDGNEDRTVIVRQSYVTYILIFACKLISMDKIKEKTAEEFWLRCNIYENLFGAWRKDIEGGSIYVTPDEVASHIGLTTNVYGKSYSSFDNTLGEWLRDEARDRAQQRLNWSATPGRECCPNKRIHGLGTGQPNTGPRRAQSLLGGK